MNNILTNKGIRLLQEYLASGVVFTPKKAVLSTRDISNVDVSVIKTYEELQDETLSVQVVNTLSYDDRLVRSTATFINTTLVADINIYALGLYVDTPTESDILFSISYSAVPDKLVAYDLSTPRSKTYSFDTKFSDAEDLTNFSVNALGIVSSELFNTVIVPDIYDIPTLSSGWIPCTDKSLTINGFDLELKEEYVDQYNDVYIDLINTSSGAYELGVWGDYNGSEFPLIYSSNYENGTALVNDIASPVIATVNSNSETITSSPGSTQLVYDDPSSPPGTPMDKSSTILYYTYTYKVPQSVSLMPEISLYVDSKLTDTEIANNKLGYGLIKDFKYILDNIGRVSGLIFYSGSLPSFNFSLAIKKIRSSSDVVGYPAPFSGFTSDISEEISQLKNDYYNIEYSIIRNKPTTDLDSSNKTTTINGITITYDQSNNKIVFSDGTNSFEVPLNV